MSGRTTGAGTDLASQLVVVVIERGDVVLPHQREEARQGNPRKLGGLPIPQVAGTDLLKKSLRSSFAHEGSIPGAGPDRSPDTCPPAGRTPVNRTDGRTAVRNGKSL